MVINTPTSTSSKRKMGQGVTCQAVFILEKASAKKYEVEF
jgi:hypothetical protein